MQDGWGSGRIIVEEHEDDSIPDIGEVPLQHILRQAAHGVLAIRSSHLVNEGTQLVATALTRSQAPSSTFISPKSTRARALFP